MELSEPSEDRLAPVTGEVSVGGGLGSSPGKFLGYAKATSGIGNVYAVLYNPMYVESVARTLSLHWTLSGAYLALRAAKVAAWERERDERLLWGIGRRGWKYLEWQWWGIRKMSVGA